MGFDCAHRSALDAMGFDYVHRSAVDIVIVDVLLRYITHLDWCSQVVGTDTDGFAGAAATDRCLVGFGVIRDLMVFVDN